MRKLVMTRLVLPFVFVAGMISIPFVWFPEVDSPPVEAPAAKEVPAPASSSGRRSPAGREAGNPAGPLQRTMTLGFALILVSVTLGGAMLYGITRRQTVSFRRRFAPKKAKEPPVKENPPPA
ncbi:MAG: hypothetical protein V3V56_10360 [bacterium]